MGLHDASCRHGRGGFISFDTFSGTIERLYAAAADPGLWGEALRSVEDLTGAAGAVVGFVPKDGGTGFVMSGRFDAELCAEYARDCVPICPRIAMAARRPDIVHQYDALLMSEAEMDRDPVYDWFERRGGVRYYLGTALPDVGRYRVDASIQRTRAQGHVQKADIDLFAKLRPHLAQALRLSDVIGTLSAQSRLAFHLLEGLPHGAVLLDGSGRVLLANAAAERIFTAHDGLDVVRDRLVAARSTDSWALRRLAAAATSSEGTRGGWLQLPRPSGKPGYALFAAPLVTDEALPGARRPAAVIAIFDPDARPGLAPETLQILYDVSRKEAEVAVLLAAGQDIGTIGASLGIATDTVRTHVKNLFRKMEVNRQQDLVSIFGSLAAMGGPDADASEAARSFAASRRSAHLP